MENLHEFEFCLFENCSSGDIKQHFNLMSLFLVLSCLHGISILYKTLNGQKSGCKGDVTFHFPKSYFLSLPSLLCMVCNAALEHGEVTVGRPIRPKFCLEMVTKNE